jgi:mRNA-degrading endonuclease RelE of RelBE toxin-antitoxin system
LEDNDYRVLQIFLIANPEAGKIIPGSGGVRKLRWSVVGRGKRGGIRVIYYLRSKKGEIWLLTLYSKSHTENIPGHILKQLKEAFEDE